jgi:uncharacterized protein (DUF2267 family)
VPDKVRTKQKFLDGVTLKLLPHRNPPERAVRGVFALLAHHCDPGEVANVIAQLPREIKDLWPEGASSVEERR